MTSVAVKAVAREMPGLVSLALRFQAWWDGRDPRDLMPYQQAPTTRPITAKEADVAAAMAAEAPIGAPASPPLHNPWCSTRIALVEKLWGTGFHTPGGAEHILELVKPMRLDESKCLLDLGCGLGGGARTVTAEFGTWVTGIEWWKDLALAGIERSTRANMSRKAAVQFQANGQLFLKPNSFAGIFSKEALFTVPEKEPVLQMISNALKIDGELCFTDYVVLGDRGMSHHLEEWCEREPIGAHPWSIAEYSSALGQLGYDLRVSEDMTERHCQLIRDGWRRLVDGLAPGSVTPETMPFIVREAEIWARREALLRKGDLRHYRFFAIKRRQGGRIARKDTAASVAAAAQAVTP